LNVQRCGQISGRRRGRRRRGRRRGRRKGQGRGRALFQAERNVKADYNNKGQVNWREEAREDFDFDAGEQLNEDDKAILQDAKRPIVIFNRVGTTVDSVSGQEVGNRQEVQFLPRRQTPDVAHAPGAVKSDTAADRL
jgi:hypothetical protein